MTYGYIEDLKFVVEEFDEGGNLLEVFARVRDLDAARAAYDACRLCTYPRAAGSCGGVTAMSSQCGRCDETG